VQNGQRVSDPVWGPPRPEEDSAAALIARREQQFEHRYAAATAITQAQLTALAARTEQRLDAIEHHVIEQSTDALAVISQRLDAVEVRFAAEAARLDDLTTLSTRLDDVLDAINIADSQRREEVETFRAELSAAKRQLDHIGPLRERSAALSQSGAQLLEEFREYQQAWATRWEDMATRVTEVEEAVGNDGMAAMEAHLDRMEDLERAVAELNPDLFVRKGDMRAGI
jgi:DNA repair exonuclease SbcCD ATPase subunit